MPDFYIFDLDGTLIDSSKEILSSIKKACKLENIETDILNETIIGKPIADIIEKILPDTDISIRRKIVENYRNIYDNISNHNIEEFKGSTNLLKTLKSKKKKIFLLTNKLYKPTKSIIDSLNWTDFFDDIYTIDKFHDIENKAKLLKILISNYGLKEKNCVYIGDCIEDTNAAKENSIISIAALWGYEKDKDLLMHKADFALEELDIEDLDSLIESLCNYFNNIV